MTTLDPDVRAVLDGIAAGGYDTGSIDRSQTDDERRADIDSDPLFQRASSGLRSREDREIPGPHGPVPVRVYTPSGRGVRPVVAYFHGGGFHSGTLDMYDATCTDLAVGSGAIIVSVDYRLAPEHTFPVPLDDCYAVTEWLAKNAHELGGDGTRLAVAGGSAGGNLAGAVALMARDRGGPDLAHQVLLFPAAGHDPELSSMTEFAEGYWLTTDTCQYCWETYIPNEEDRHHPYASLIDAPDLAGLPPALVITAECDPLRDVGEAYAARLAEAGVATRLSRYFGQIHGFTLMAGEIRRGKEALAEVANSLAHHLASPLSIPAQVDLAEVREVMRAYFEDHLASHDLDAADSFHGENYLWHAPSGRTLNAEETSDFVRYLYRTHRDMTVDLHEVVADGDIGVARFTMTGIQTERWAGMEPTGQKRVMRGQIMCRIADATMVEAWELIVQDLV